ncbi:TonB-dependent receptor [Caulobacter sp. UNC279MFTsu5.1]|uniref:TonB-dependent receptor n=1 Tax=Caulobacter sp. UNC279MFTsu5.1 TaxID=1502775 RepID=UPI0004A2BC1A|nr:TonB-dependent receptor [Caulobacter sp. UNC279MFTsu5.1]SFJ37945.1 TonB-dependent receptor [Caulobacter sp. UNC279MFTsu5.1]
MKSSIRARRLLVAGASVGVLCALAAPVAAQDKSSGQDASSAKDGKTVETVTEVVVTARRKALQSAIEIKKNADTIVDSIVADEAGKLPDNSITEVLQRVSGVSISRFTSTNGGSSAFQIEGTGVTVRGLPFNSSMLNGQQLFSANGASAISWNEVTPELMAGVDVYKATRADLIEGGASSINLRTHLPFDFRDTQINLTAGGSYGTLAKKASPRVSAMYSKRFDTNIGEFGVLWDLAYSRLHQQSSDLQVGAMFAEYTPTSKRDDHLAFVPSSFNWSNSQSKRDRYGAYQAIQWKPTSNLTLTNTVFYTQYVEDGRSNSGGVGSSPSAASAVMPKVGSPVEYDANGGFRKGSLTVGSTGNAVEFQNITPGWVPSWYQLNCGATYGAPASSLQWDWSANGGVDPSSPDWDGKRLAQCGPAGTFNPSGGASASHSKNSTLDISQSFVWTPGDRVAVRGGAQFVRSKATGQNMFININQSSPLVNSMEVDLTGSLPAVSGLSTAGLLDKSTAYLSSMAYHKPNNRGEMVAAHIDLEYRVSDDGFLRSVSVGARTANRIENDDNAGTYWAPLGQSWLANPWGPHPGDPTYGTGNIQYLTNPNVLPSDYEVATFENFFGGKAAVPAQLYVGSQSLLQSYDWYHLLKTYNGQLIEDPPGSGQMRPRTKEEFWRDNIDQGLNRTDSRIVNKAAYVQAKFASDGIGFVPAFSGNIGVRVFHESLRASGLLSTPAAANLALNQTDSTAYFVAQQIVAADPTATPTFPTLYGFTQAYSMQNRSYEYTRVLPSFNVKFDVSDKFKIRAAASRSSAPPNLNDIRAGGSIGARTLANPTDPRAPSILTGVSVNGGGANLKPTMINSEDLAFELYPSSSSFFYVDVFAKQIEDHPQFYSFIQNNLPIPALAYANGQSTVGTPTSLDLPWLYLQNRTATEKADIKGFEIGGRKFFDQLPGVFKGFGLEGNVTYIDSTNPAQQANNVLSKGLNPDGTIPQTYPDLPYAGLSKWAYNIQLLYSRDRVNFRLAYNWRSRALLSTNVNPLSYATSGGNPYTLNTSPTNFDADHSFPVYNMVPAYMAAAGYLDLGFDYKLSEKVSVSFNANNLLNTKSKTLQEPVPGVFEPYDYNVSDRRYEVTMRARF